MRALAPHVVFQLLGAHRRAGAERLEVGRVHHSCGQLHDFDRVVDHAVLFLLPEVGVLGPVAVGRPQRLADGRDNLGDFPRVPKTLHDVVQDVEASLTLRAENDQVVFAAGLAEDALPHAEVLRLGAQDQPAAPWVPDNRAPQRPTAGAGLARSGPADR